ncbi:MAG TPA: SDR family NAD(P)-dependent oxidoreductase [Candidatus Binataceae bacterium]|nr:SDR family NAD(P)-dependent oxidoreductase [Candidatus Binataceae bacterium]
MATVIITGGAGGLGTAIGQALLARGDRVISFDLKPAHAATRSIELDVTQEAEIAAAVLKVHREFDDIQGLVCAAGVVAEAPLAQLTLTQWHRVLDVSLTSAFLAIRALLPMMEARKRGKIVAFSSGYGRKGYRHGAAYAAAKAGIEALIKSTALEYAGRGVTANAIAPGPIQTPMLDLVPRERVRALEEAIPMGRVGQPSDIAGAVLFFLDPASDYINGQVLHINGGLLMP